MTGKSLFTRFDASGREVDADERVAMGKKELCPAPEPRSNL
jgi:hypothetical protein